MPEVRTEILVIGVGNLLMTDDGVGIHAVNELRKEKFDPGVKVVDGGTTGIDLFFWLEDACFAIIIDCVEAKAKPGTIIRLRVEETLSELKKNIISLHEIGIGEVLFEANRLGKLPPTVIYGVQPEEISLGSNLSQVVKNSLPRLVDLVKQEINTAKILVKNRLELQDSV